MQPKTSRPFASTASLSACDGCARHVRSDEARCPFCDAPVAKAALARQPPSIRLGRSALYAFGVGALSITTALAACNHESDGPVAPVYGAPPEFWDVDAGHDAAQATVKPPPPAKPR